ncbi:uncharacterized protein [Euphorbia lathyris]|uniref:uncharacterized protein n=1 Tax=Euphorbia lathyris TaxID=212925 RepID=UPI0033131427
MRFKKGTKVEVLSRKDGSFGVWRSAEILSGDQHSFSVMYDHPPNHNNEDRVAKVSSNAIRPCPPPMFDLSHCWTPGDLVEVFQDFSWKTAAILKVFGSDYYMVKLIGCSRELRLRKVHIRVRRLWQDGEWIAIGQGSRNLEDSKKNKLIHSSCYTKITTPTLHAQAAENCLTVENNTGLQHSCAMTDRTLKRASPFLSSNGKASKIRVMEKKGDRREVMSRCSASFLKKVDAVVCPQECFGEIYMRESSFHARSLERNESDTDGCSVASCSVISNNPVCSPPLVGNEDSDDAESFLVRRDEEGKRYPSVEVNLAVRIHSLELHAYRCTLEALYASGPLNWEQEVMLTNLRMSLNISNDEHLLELRNLISFGSSICIR